MPQKKITISFNIFFCGTSSTSVSEKEAPATEEDTRAHVGTTPTLLPRGAIRLRVWELHHLEVSLGNESVEVATNLYWSTHTNIFLKSYKTENLYLGIKKMY